MSNLLSILNVSITNNCNLKCKHCAATINTSSNKISELSVTEYKNLFKQASDLGCSEVILSGGEPFLRNDIFEIIKVADYFNLKCSILSNGTLITKKVLDSLKSCTNIKYIRFSLDFYNNDEMEIFRGLPKIPDLIWDAIENINKIGINTAINISIMPENINQIYNIYTKAKNIGVSSLRAVPIIPIGRAKNTKIDELFYEKSIEKMFEIHKDNSNCKNFHSNKSIDSIIENMIMPCVGGLSTISISPTGFFSLCPFVSHKNDLYNIRKISLKDVWDIFKEEHFNITSSMLTNSSEKCKKCTLNKSCMCGCLAEIESRYSSFKGDQPICLKSILNKVIAKDPSTLDVLNFLSLQVDLLKLNNFSMCIRNLPIWSLKIN